MAGYSVCPLYCTKSHEYMIILELIAPKIKTSDVQFAYKNNFSTTMYSFLVGETIQYYRNNGSNVFALLLDASKAFDKVQYTKLFKLLRARDICPLILRLLLNMYIVNTALVIWCNVQSDEFNVKNGVKQGGVPCPHLFTIYVEPLIIDLRASKVGCHIGSLISNAFMYADDIIILSPTLSAMSKLVLICEGYAKEYFLIFNLDKCYLLIFSDNTHYIINNINIRINGVLVKTVDTERHLGNNLSTKRNIFEFKDVIVDMKARTNSIINNFSNISFNSKIMLFNSQCLSLYGAQLWNLRDPDIDVLGVTWRKCVRYLLGLPYRTSSYILPLLMKTLNIKDIIMERQLNFYVNMYNHSSVFINGYIKNSLLSQSSYSVSNINAIANRYDIAHNEIFHLKKASIKRLIQRQQPAEDWRCNVIREVLHCLDGQMHTCLGKEELKDVLTDVCTYV